LAEVFGKLLELGVVLIDEGGVVREPGVIVSIWRFLFLEMAVSLLPKWNQIRVGKLRIEVQLTCSMRKS